MATPYDDGLDDFDRDLLCHPPLPPSPTIRDFPHMGYFSGAHTDSLLLYDSANNYDTPYDAHPVQKPVLELGKRRQTMDSGYDRPMHGANMPWSQPAHRFAQIHRMSQLGDTPPQTTPYGRGSLSAKSNASSSQPPVNSSPTARLSARKRPPAQNLPRTRFEKSLDSSSSTLVSPDPAGEPPVVHGIPLVCLRQALPNKFRAIFPYELFNAVQSKCFDVVYGTNDNVVVSAPTGSGKTAIFELAICKLAYDRGKENFKIIYQAPTKALCSEKARDWEKKFSYLNLKCAELTGDTSQTEMRRVGDASIIVTTPEKWDSITRKWQDHRRLLQMVELFLIDEVHILKDMRGATLEAVVSRMKTIGANVRFIALSATVPNSDDIAIWLGRNHTTQQLPAHREAFGEEFRPVKLQRYVYGFESGGNDFIFDRYLDQKLPGLLSRHAQRKPILIFCFTRKSCESTASMLADYASERPEGENLWPVPSQRIPVLSRELQEIIRFGVAFHHAGLDAQDRNAIEQNFLNGQLGVICCTTTLAVGINLPCHTVVLKGTVGFTDEKLEEYSDLEVMQMLGRAGRPQFDDSATAIILTRSANKQRYEKMVSGQEILESTLHRNLIEHLNSEICLGTISDLSSAKTWLAGTFLSVRLRRNPDYYRLTGGMTSPSQIDERMEEICEREIKQLQDAELVTGQSTFKCTEYGSAMSRYMVEFHTMKMLLQIPRAVGMENLITILAQASEFKEFRFKPSERALFREINQSPLIMYPIKETVTQTWHKISLMIQTHLGCVQYPDSGEAAKARRQLQIEKKLIFERLHRLVRAVIDCKGHDRDAVGTKTALELARALAAESWEGRATQLTQVPSIGPVGMRKLASKNIRTVLELADKDYGEIERLMSRQPPYGKNLQTHLEKFPRLDFELMVVDRKTFLKSEEPVVVEVKAILRYLNRNGPPTWLNRAPVLTFLAESGDGVLVYFWRGSSKKLNIQAGFELRFSVGLRDVRDRVVCHFTCEEIVGTIVSKTLDPKLPASAFPAKPVPTRTGLSRRRESGSQEYMDNDGIDDSDLILAAEQAFSHPSMKQGKAGGGKLDSDGYASVEDFIGPTAVGQHASNQAVHDPWADGRDEENGPDDVSTTRAPVQLPNGKWQCNHACSGGAPTRSGRPCSHRCCKDGLERPRRRPQSRPKRTREEPSDEPALDSKDQRPSQTQDKQLAQPSQGVVGSWVGNGAKRHKKRDTSTLTEPQFVQMRNHANQKSKNQQQHADFDVMDLECIDLSHLDDEDDGLDIRFGDSTSRLRKEPNTNASHKVLQTVSVRQTQRTDNTQGQWDSSVTMGSSAKRETVSASKASQRIEYFDDDDLSVVGETLSPMDSDTAITPANAAAFRSGASDEALYQGISKEFPKAEETGPRSSCPPVPKEKIETATIPSNLSSSLSMDNIGFQENSDLAHQDKVPPVSASEGKEEGKPRKQITEPAWVAEFDPEFVDMLRGYVAFV